MPSLGRSELARLTEFIEDQYRPNHRLAELAAIVNVSRFHFTRLFKRSTGMTAISYVEQCRIRRAQSLILETDLPLAEVALLTGFADQSHFTRRFHRRIGCTPAAFARNTVAGGGHACLAEPRSRQRTMLGSWARQTVAAPVQRQPIQSSHDRPGIVVVPEIAE